MLQYQRYSPLGSAGDIPLVLLHGWGFDHRSMEPFVQPLRELGEVWSVDIPGFGEVDADFDADAFIAVLARELPAQVYLIGWSLGGALALDFALSHPERVASLVTLATNPKFVADGDWPQAMDSRVNRGFNRGFAQQPEATLKQFCALVAQGSRAERPLVRTMRQRVAADAAGRQTEWSEALAYLAATDFRARAESLKVPGLHIYAANDGLVPAACGEFWNNKPDQQSRLVAEASHCLHWDQPSAVVKLISDFVRPAGKQLDKARIARSFSKAAPSYESAARLQKRVGERLLSAIDSRACRVLDAGCGTGYFLPHLKDRTQAQELTALDLAQGMLSYARQHHRDVDHWVCADLEAMPLPSNSVDLIYSSLAVQWCEDLMALACELYRVLDGNGRLYLATLDEGTLAELRQAWQRADGYVHVNRFYPVGLLAQALEAAGFTNIRWHTETEVIYAPSFRHIARELKDLGAHNLNAGAPRGLTGRQRLRALESAYEAFRVPEGLPASYQVTYLQASKTVP
ncbi:malonyl-ACP O-methyltransferase BioC [Gilvimarinus xylanilyticus]|uniref:Malonyl-[acyl-carrier protein] O-methyltransferase n=1 Tax=Gilvimarinus xylanilyticus TaxID=2944139 RepID=A0A9X2KU19_9GAMM|nr:malonyl-ACP O-methyltransferase BioC [Gilvimarinus xylanilyticus]MCP8899787.1 malonyl-ACP O-methyltransferase BioC [Gilvimarinus xylanilyticus]